jgi:hypothetical protein
MTDQKPYVPFGQRYELEPMPTQFELGVVPIDLRLLLELAFEREMKRNSSGNYNGRFFNSDWITVAEDFHVKFRKKNLSSSATRPHELSPLIVQSLRHLPFPVIFNLTEFFIRHNGCSDNFKSDIKDAFQASFSAYRVFDNQIVAIGNDEQADAFVAAIAATETASADGARKHLINAGQKLKATEWSDSVRESIHAVEAVAKFIEPSEETLGPALDKIARTRHLHPAMKGAFQKLYGYTSDENGIRHASVFDPKAKVDETDALFMLGACASFVSYLLARHRQAAK